MNRCKWVIPTLYKVRPTVARVVIDKISKRDGVVTPASLLESASSRRSPIHGCFEWDDTVAAGRFRVEQARRMLKDLIIVSSNGEAREYRAYVHVSTKSVKGFQAIVQALGDPESREYILARAMEDLAAFERKYRSLKELAGLLHSMRAVRKKLRPKKRKRATSAR